MFSLSSLLDSVLQELDNILPPNYEYFLLTKIYANPILEFLFRSLKYLVRLIFGTHQLDRILAPYRKNDTLDESSPLNNTNKKLSPITILVLEIYLTNSVQIKSLMTKIDRELIDVDGLFEDILLKKQTLQLDEDLQDFLKVGLIKIVKTRKLRSELEEKRATSIDWNVKSHESKLKELWKALNPEVELTERKSKMWKDLGFQGVDPATDFRGVGLLGLEDLLYFSQTYPELARVLLARANDHPTRWYGFSIIGLHLTNFCIHLLTTRQLQYYLYTTDSEINCYHEVYCWLFCEFDQFWFDPQVDASSIQFEQIFGKFQAKVSNHLYLLKPLMIK